MRTALVHTKRLQMLATHHGTNPKMVAEWRKRTTQTHAPMKPVPASVVLTVEEEAITMSFRRHTLLLLDDCPTYCRPPFSASSVQPCPAGFSAISSAGCFWAR